MKLDPYMFIKVEPHKTFGTGSELVYGQKIMAQFGKGTIAFKKDLPKVIKEAKPLEMI